MAAAVSCSKTTTTPDDIVPTNDLQERTKVVDQCGKWVLNILGNSPNQELHRSFHTTDRRKIIENLLDLRTLSSEEAGQALMLAIETSSLKPEDRNAVIHRLLETGTISSIFLGRAVCLATRHFDRGLVEQLLAKGPIPELPEPMDYLAAPHERHVPSSWLEAVNLALRQNARSIIGVLFACNDISVETRCQAFYDAFRCGYQGRLDWLLDFVPNRDDFRRTLIGNATKDNFQGVAAELMAHGSGN